MTVTKERTMPFKTPLGDALVWGLVNSSTHGIAGWHFMFRGENGSEHYYSHDGRIFSGASVHPPDLLLGPEETDRAKLRILRKLWEEYIMHLDIYPVDRSDIVTIN